MLRRDLPAIAAVGSIVACAAVGCSAPARRLPQEPARPAPTEAGRWVGVVRIPSVAPLQLTIVLDSSAVGWQGTVLVPSQGAEPVTLASVARVRDSLVLTLPASAQGAVMRLHLSTDGARLDGLIATGPSGTVTAAREGSAAAVALAGTASRIAESRALANRLAQTPPAAAPSDDPDAAKLVTGDIALFWSAVDRAPRDSLPAWLQHEYLDRASPGVREFIPGRIMSAEDLAAAVEGNRARYDSVRASNLDVSAADPAIRAAFRRLKALYPPAVFPDVYFVIGRFNSGGTSTKHGLLIGAEMYRDPARLPAIVSHELIHFQQHYPSPTLLEHSFMEGTADFIGEMISGAQINNDAHQYGLAHEHQLWLEFQAHLDDRNFFPWMYGRPPDGRPNDLGYFIGYRIAQAYYQQATDKAQAIREIIAGDAAGTGSIRGLLARSGYAP
jgi:Predicted Zn-dependent protease (DUF2268)